jgi:hypothetical protein
MAGGIITLKHFIEGAPRPVQYWSDDGTPKGNLTQIFSDGSGNTGSAAPSATSSISTVNAATSATLLLAPNTARLGATIVNDSTAILYVLLGTGTVSPTNYTYAIDAKTTVPGFVDIPDNWVGQISGIWSAANGKALITERAA